MLSILMVNLSNIADGFTVFSAIYSLNKSQFCIFGDTFYTFDKTYLVGQMCRNLFNKFKIHMTYWTIYLMGGTVILGLVQSVETS